MLAVDARPRPAPDAAEFAASALAPPLSDSASATALSRSTYTCSFSLYELKSWRVVYRNEAAASKAIQNVGKNTRQVVKGVHCNTNQL